MKSFFDPVLAGSSMLHGPNPTKTRFILKHKLRTLQYLRAHGILQNSNPSILCGSWARWRERYIRLLSSSSSVPSICGRMYRRNLSGRRLRLICDRNYLLLEYLPSLENWSTLTQPAPQNWIYSVSKEALCHYLEGQQRSLNDRRRIFTECKGYANKLWHVQ